MRWLLAYGSLSLNSVRCPPPPCCRGRRLSKQCLASPQAVQAFGPLAHRSGISLTRQLGRFVQREATARSVQSGSAHCARHRLQASSFTALASAPFPLPPGPPPSGSSCRLAPWHLRLYVAAVPSLGLRITPRSTGRATAGHLAGSGAANYHRQRRPGVPPPRAG